MKIYVEYNGSTAKCRVENTFSNTPTSIVDLENADKMSQVLALDAFRTILNHWEREHEKDNLPICHLHDQ